MKASTTNPVQKYLKQLGRVTSDLPNEERAELLSNIAEHLADAESRNELPATLAALGTPEEVANEARMNSVSPASKGSSSTWATWAILTLLVGTIAGFTLLGAMLAVTARFDEDADWNLHPALVIFAVIAGTIAGLATSVAVIASHRWKAAEKVALVALWVASLLVAFFGSELALVTPAGTGFFIAGAIILLGALEALAAIALTLRAVQRSNPRSRS
jgi:uncharacterized membrane protein